MQKRFIAKHHDILSRRIKIEIVQLVQDECGPGPIIRSGVDTNIDLDALPVALVQRIYDIVTARREALCRPSTTGEIDD